MYETVNEFKFKYEQNIIKYENCLFVRIICKKITLISAKHFSRKVFSCNQCTILNFVFFVRNSHTLYFFLFKIYSKTKIITIYKIYLLGYQ